MATPSLQTFITDSSQVLNLGSISAVRSVVAVALANANTGTPLNPNLTTQQLWNEFYQVVTEPKSNIESFIANQMMKFLFSPPAPGGAGANTQVIFNDMGVLAGDAGLVYNKTTDALTVTGLVTAGSATISGDLTVDTNVLKVNTTTNRVGINTTTPDQNLDITGSGNPLSADGTCSIKLKNTVSGRPGLIGLDNTENFLFWNVGNSVAETIKFLTGGGSGSEQYRITHGGVFNWYDGSGNGRMTLNSTGLGIGDSPASGEKLTVLGSIYLKTANKLKLDNASNNFGASIHNIGASAQAALAFTLGATQAMTLDASGNLLVGVTSASNQERLNLTSAVSLYVARVFNTASSGGNYGIAIRYSNAAPNNGSNEFLACSDSAASRAFIYSNGGIANYQANDSNLSDARTKTDIKPLISYWNKIKALELVTFKYKDQTHSDDNIGLIAQQVESVAPEFVSNDGFGETPADGVPLKTIYSTDLYHAAIKALQEAMTRIEVLESKLA